MVASGAADTYSGIIRLKLSGESAKDSNRRQFPLLAKNARSGARSKTVTPPKSAPPIRESFEDFLCVLRVLRGEKFSKTNPSLLSLTCPNSST
jgi:hypothetical protein